MKKSPQRSLERKVAVLNAEVTRQRDINAKSLVVFQLLAAAQARLESRLPRDPALAPLFGEKGGKQ